MYRYSYCACDYNMGLGCNIHGIYPDRFDKVSGIWLRSPTTPPTPPIELDHVAQCWLVLIESTN
jgi:hypothetical protein